MSRQLIFLVCLFGLSLVSCEMDYKPGTTYQYQYRSYVLTGSPEVSNDYTGFKFDFDFRLHCMEKTDKGRKMVFQIRNVTQFQIGGDTSPLYPNTYDGPDDLVEGNISRRIAGVSADDLKRPLEFIWTNDGYIIKIKKNGEDSIDSINLKRGLLSMLSGNFGGIPLTHTVGMGIIPWKAENGIEGTCQTAYTYIISNNKTFELLKVRDLSQCSDLPTRVDTNFRRDVIKGCKNPFDSEQYRSERVQSAAQTRVQVRRTKKGSFLESGVTRSRFGMKTPGRRRQDLVTYINQNFTFMKTLTKKVSFPDTKGSKATSLKMELPPIPGEIKSEEIFQKKAVDILEEMKANKLTIKFAKLQTTLSKLLRRATEKQIKSVLEWAQERKLRSSVESILSVVGTKVSIKVIIDIVKDPKVLDVRAARLVAISSISSGKPRFLIKEFKKLAFEKIMQAYSRRATAKALWIGLGSLYNEIRTADNDEKLSREIRELALKSQKEGKPKFMSQEMKTITMLMALGNSGLKGTLEIIKEKMARKYSLSIRLQAIQAVRKIAPQKPYEIRRLMYTFYADRSEDNEIRLNAFISLVRTNPTRYQLGFIVAQLLQEKSLNIRNFVVSFLMNLARTRDRSLCVIRMAINARWVLRTLPRRMVVVSKFLSRVFYIPVKSTKFIVMYGSIIYAKDSALPRSFHIAQGFVSNERKGQFWAMEFRSIGSQQKLRDMLSRFGSILSAMNMPDVFSKKAKSKGMKGKERNFMSVRNSMFGEDVFMINGSFSNVMRRTFQLMKGDLSFLLEDIYQQATSIGLPLTVEKAISGTRTLEMKFMFAVNDEKERILEHSIKSSHNVLMQGSMGTTAGHAYSLIGIDKSVSVNPGGNTTLDMKNTWTNKSSKFQLHLLPYGKEHVILKAGTRFYRKTNYGKTPKSNETDLNLRVLKKTFSNTVGSSFGLPIEYSATLLSQRGSRRLSYSRSLVIRKGKICGIGTEFELADIQQKKGKEDEEVEEEIEEEVEDEDDGEDDTPDTVELRKAGKSLSDEAKESLTPYSMYSSVPGIGNKAFNVRLFIFLADKKMTKKTIGDIKLEVRNDPNSKFVNAKMSIKTPASKRKLELEGNISTIGTDIFFNPSNPFEITTNTGGEVNLKVIYGGRTLFSVQRNDSISDDWVSQWKELLRRPEMLSRDYPEIYQCVKDIEKDSAYGNSPNCIRAWEILQTYNQRTVSVTGPSTLMRNRFSSRRAVKDYLPNIRSIIKYAEKIFTTVNFRFMNNRMTGNMTFVPIDVEKTKMQMLLKDSFSGWPLYMTCGVALNRGRKSVLVNTFDGQNLEGKLPDHLFKDQSLIIAQDRRRGEFFIASTYGKIHSTLIYYVVDGKNCSIRVSYDNKKSEVNYEIMGSGCDQGKGKDGETYVIDDGCTFFYNASHVTIPRLKIKVEVSPCRNIRIRLGAYYHDSLRGICGNMDREPYENELLGKSCKRAFKNADNFVNDYVVKEPLNQPTCN